MSAKDLGWVYVRFGNDYKNYPVLRKGEFNTLLEAVARSVGRDKKKLIKIDEGKDGKDRETISWGETKKYIAQEATRIIEQVARVDNGTHMALYSSKRQIKRLIGVCEHTDYRLSCYSLVALHVIYISIDENMRQSMQATMGKLNELIFGIANEFIVHHSNNDLAQYIVDCHLPLKKEINHGKICGVEDFPCIHR